MFALLRFNGCKTYNICKYDKVKKSKDKYIAKWNGVYYEANLLLINKYEVVQSFCKNINNGLPLVLLKNFIKEREACQVSNSLSTCQTDNLEFSSCPQRETDGLSAIPESCMKDNNDLHTQVKKTEVAVEDARNVGATVEFESIRQLTSSCRTNFTESFPQLEADLPIIIIESCEIINDLHTADLAIENVRNVEPAVQFKSIRQHTSSCKTNFRESFPQLEADLPITIIESGESNNGLHTQVNESELAIKNAYEAEPIVKYELTQNFDTNTSLIIPNIPELSGSNDFSLSPNLGLNYSHEVEIQKVEDSSVTKKYFCMFCNKLIQKFARHIETVHKDKEEVKKFLLLPKGSSERILIIDDLRKKSSFLYNTSKNYNTGSLIVSRQPQKKYQRTPDNFKVCPNCKLFCSISSFRRHYVKCNKDAKKGERNTLQKSKIIHGQLHKKASETVRTKIFSVLRDDECVKIVRYDELVIIFCNKLTEKYRDPHHYSMIRSRVRTIGRFLCEFKNLDNNFTNFACVFHPKQYDNVIKAINSVACFDFENQKYKSPSTAFSLGTLFKKCGKILINEYIKKSDEEGKRNVENFLNILDEDFAYSVNKTVQENQLLIKRQKVTNLPPQDDVKKLNNYLKEQKKNFYCALETCFKYESWKKLSEFTLISIQVFNRRRPGELQRVLISDFKSYQSVNEDTDKELFSTLSKSAQVLSKRYVRFTIRGKLGREVPVLLNEDLLKCVKMILRFREEAGVAKENPYLFGLPGVGGNGFKYLMACNLLRKFSSECGAEKPNLLRATELRKHIASRSVLLNLQDQDVTDLARFLGHEKKIHEDHYRIPIVTRDIVQMAKFLEIAQGEGEPQNYEETDRDDEVLTGHKRKRSEPQNCEETESVDEVEIGHKGNRSEPQNCEETETGMDHEVKTRHKKRKISESPHTDSRRRSWDGCHEKVSAIFKFYIEAERLPSIEYCCEIINTFPELQRRSPMQLKAWVSNQIQKNKKKEPAKRNRRSTIYWSQEDKLLMTEIFKESIQKRKTPSMHLCQQMIDKYPQLQLRSKETVKAWVYNEIVRRKK